MGLSPETIASDARPREGLPRRAAGLGAPVPGVRGWVLAAPARPPGRHGRRADPGRRREAANSGRRRRRAPRP